MIVFKLSSPLGEVLKLTDTQIKLLKEELGIYSIQDLIHLFPYKYIDRSHYTKINELRSGNVEVQIIGYFSHLKMIPSKGRGKNRIIGNFVDKTGNIEIVWFGADWILKNIQIGIVYVIFGRVTYFNHHYQITHPEVEPLEKHKQRLARIVSVYPSTEKLSKKNISSSFISKLLYQIFKQTQGNFAETLSQDLLRSLNLPSKSEALLQIHFPNSQEQLSKAQYRLKFEELFFIQLRLLCKNIAHKQREKGFVFAKVGDLFLNFYNNHLDFELTNAQKKVLKEIRQDLKKGIQMNRLLQGDVGSGKTIVCLLSCLIAIDSGFQACVVAPTEILAQQHYQYFKCIAKEIKIEVGILTGSVKTKDRKHLIPKITKGEIKILIGTHAIFEDTIVFDNLGIAIIDEQHRFGVAQRAKLWKKNTLPPHILNMSATPIPRTLAMSLYGDLDISIIDELPPNRKKIKTIHKKDNHRLEIIYFMKKQIELGQQIYIVYPLIEESEVLDYKDLIDGFASLERDFPKPKYQISIVHGQMNAEDKEREMQRFVKGQTNIMIATTVIEVGVDVPNASVIIIESAERFGLSQLHQLRGRVGRGANQSYCVLMTGQNLTKDAYTRIKTMVNTTDGFKIAEVDLKLRGPGNIMGTQQSGILNLKIADISRDGAILELARNCAKTILEQDPKLTKPNNKPIQDTYYKISEKDFKWESIS